MAILSSVELLVICLLASLSVSAYRQWSKLSHIPGPRFASISYLWGASKAIRGRSTDYEGLGKYGRLVRVAPNYILTDDPDIIKQVNHARSLARRDDWYNGANVEPDKPNLVTTTEIGPHDELKAKAVHGYNGRDKMDFERSVDLLIAQFIDILRERHLSRPGQLNPVDFALLARYFTLDAITEIGFGGKLGFLDSKEDLFGYTRSVENIAALVATASDVPILRRILTAPVVARFFAPTPKDDFGMGKIMGIGHGIVHDRFKTGDTSHPDMIGAFMRHGMTEKETQTEIIVQIVAGSDTTATAIRSTLLFLMTCPRAYNQIKQGLIYEGLRMRPPVLNGFYKEIPPLGETINSIKIPGGTGVGWNMPAMMRRQDIFGQDAQIFRPERFVECDEAKRLEMIRTVELVFGHGRWTCAGKKLAIIELNKIFFELMRAFDFQVINGTKPIEEEAYTIYVQRDMWISVTEASKS
ncbi:cytochrome P450 [Coniochaeta sp. 2T2.1]|nr:cytochrome P450 [Coniochaeta sp. 2T2.1]